LTNIKIRRIIISERLTRLPNIFFGGKKMAKKNCSLNKKKLARKATIFIWVGLILFLIYWLVIFISWLTGIEWLINFLLPLVLASGFCLVKGNVVNIDTDNDSSKSPGSVSDHTIS
jgi:hypothetical protein